MSETKSLKLEVTADGAGVITMNRPDVHNAFDDQLIKDLIRALEKMEQHDKVRVLVLKAEGKSFSAGADLNWMRRMADYSWSENYQDSLALASLMQKLYQFKKPTIGLIQGAAFGGGVGLVACCDIAIASDQAKFCLSEVKLGLIPAVISPYVIAAMGKRQANRYFITAERFDAETAARIGLVQQCVPADNFESYCDEVIKTTLQNGPEAIQAAKNLISFIDENTYGEEMIRETAQKISDIRASKEGKEGVSAFLEKRTPNWIAATKTQQEQ
ncbi:enoyl-CoA hydratase/isomerase family protein [Pleionea sediminis]|uniref:enoyl-CoA hydratase/isomerase family protein n=1 Tax=Pleionea sediminis TaxID=2569479 RepID=UPI0011862BF3|nr:enoyl-CoA hydratase/isomerase family protein [Pleionea sediminis]